MGNWPWPFLIQIIGDALGLKKKQCSTPRQNRKGQPADFWKRSFGPSVFPMMQSIVQSD